MVRLTAAFFALSTLLSAVVASPLPSENLEKRVTHSGRGTWYNTGLGACGNTNNDGESVIAISADIYGAGGNCGQVIVITNTATGATAMGTVEDKCPGCDATSLDMSPALFQQLGSLDQGVLPISWHFMNKAFKLE